MRKVVKCPLSSIEQIKEGDGQWGSRGQHSSINGLSWVVAVARLCRCCILDVKVWNGEFPSESCINQREKSTPIRKRRVSVLCLCLIAGELSEEKAVLSPLPTRTSRGIRVLLLEAMPLSYWTCTLLPGWGMPGLTPLNWKCITVTFSLPLPTVNKCWILMKWH